MRIYGLSSNYCDFDLFASSAKAMEALNVALSDGVLAFAGPKKTPDNYGFPVVIRAPAPSPTFNASDWVTANQTALEFLLARHGCILFRGFSLPDAAAFGSFVSGFKGWVDLPYEDSLSLAVRVPVCPRVCTTNEGRSGGLVWHHEQAAAPRYPSKVCVDTMYLYQHARSVASRLRFSFTVRSLLQAEVEQVSHHRGLYMRPCQEGTRASSRVRL